MAAEQRQIAEALNLSKATISRSLRNDPMISAATRARVYEQAIRMGYRPRDGVEELAARLSGKNPLLMKQSSDGLSTGLIHLGALCCGGLSPQFAGSVVALRLLHGISTAARAADATIHTEYLTSQECSHLDDPTAWPAVLRQGIVSGIVLVHPLPRPVLEALAGRFPCVHFFWPELETPVDCVTDDSISSMRQLVQHLHGLGHHRIGLVQAGRLTSDRARFAAYIMSLDELGLEYSPTDSLFITGDSPGDVVEHVIGRAAEGVHAWVCTDDFWGYKLVEGLKARKVRVPEDVSVCGFDNFSPPPGLPKLTSIEGPFENIGALAIERLMRRISEPAVERIHIMLDCRLVIGQSTGPA